MAGKLNWTRGRKSICGDGKSKVHSFKICPTIAELLKNYSEKIGVVKSVIVNEAIQAYIKNNEK